MAPYLYSRQGTASGIMLISPQMSHPTSSNEWWNEIVTTAKGWYETHQSMKPFKIIYAYLFVDAKEVAQTGETGLEPPLRGSSGSPKEDIISTKSITALNILPRLMQKYQPGGAHEKVGGDHRAPQVDNINVALPDPTILLSGLDK